MVPNVTYNLTSVGRKICLFSLLIFVHSGSAQDVLEPPTLGQETKGAPATNVEMVDEIQSLDATPEPNQESESRPGLLGKTEINEQRRESGQVYRIELKHSSGSTQYIEENDNDGKLESTDNDIEVTPNLAKWRIGSW